MNKRIRQYVGLLAAVAAYYLIHEGAHLVYALFIGTFKQINPGTLGVQINVYAERMTEVQMGIFCIIGSIGIQKQISICFNHNILQLMLFYITYIIRKIPAL